MGIPGCAVILCHHGKEIYSCEKGYANIQTRLPFQRNQTIRLFSNTKIFTVVALMTLFEQGAFSLDDPLDQYLPEFQDVHVGYVTPANQYKTRNPKTHLSIRDCLTMSSGIPYNISADQQSLVMQNTSTALTHAIQRLAANKPFSCRAFSKAIAQVPLLFDPGTAFAYGYSLDILGALIEVLSGMDFESYLQKAIFKPLALQNTGFWMRNKYAEKLIPLYNESNLPNQPLDPIFQNLQMFMSGGGGLLSTLDDLSALGCALSMGGMWKGGPLLGRNTINLIRQNHLNATQMRSFHRIVQTDWSFLKGYGYGLGVWTHQNSKASGSLSSIGQFGWNGAAGTSLFIDPDKQLSIAYAQQVLPNVYANQLFPRLVNAAYALL